jgi:hypothetical protein
MNIRTRHLGILVYGGLVALIVFKDIITDPVHIIALTAPIIALAIGDKVEAIAKGLSGKDAPKV